jgi:hypothetical protein
MSRVVTGRRGGVLALVADYLVEPADAEPCEPALVSMAGHRPVVAVAGLKAGCGTTVLARALGAELALRDSEGAAVVTAIAAAGVGVPLGTPAATRLARSLSRALPVRVRAVGRLCLTECDGAQSAELVDRCRDFAPLVLDVADPSQLSVAASLADVVVLAGMADTEPALAAVLSESLGRVGPEPLVVLNRDLGESPEWEGRCDLRLPEARIGAQLALVGREPRGELGRAVAELADRIGAAW